MTPSLVHIQERLLGSPTSLSIDHTGDLAAVALIFREQDEETEILVIRRAERKGDPWSGHIAFPGGRVDPSDVTTQATAERETLEEIGLDLTLHGHFLGTLELEAPVRQPNRAAMLVAPYVYSLVSEPTEYVLNDEVAELHWSRIGPMLRHQTVSQFAFVHEGRSLSLPSFDINGHPLWGMSFRMLNRLFSTIDADFQPLSESPST